MADDDAQTQTVGDVIAVIKGKNWVETERAKGFRRFEHPTLPGRVTLPDDLEAELGRGSIESIRKQTRSDKSGEE